MRSPWWIHPARLTACFLIPLYAFLVYAVPARWPDAIVLRAPDYMNGQYALFGLIVLIVFSFFAFLGSRIVVSRERPAPRVVPPAALGAVGALTIAAYLIWFFPLVVRGHLFLERDELSHMPGITSFTQLGVPFVLCYLYCTRVAGQRFGSAVRFEFWLILLLTVVRVFAWSERLAAIEVFVPALLVVFVHERRDGSAPDARRGGRVAVLVRKLVGFGGPLLAMPLLLVGFTVTEYFRSWTIYAVTQRASLTEFMLARVTTYYYTALNNGAGLLATRWGEWPSGKFLYVVEWLYRLPAGIGDALYGAVMGARPWPADDFLNQFGDPEFNNMSGIFPIAYDLGFVGGALYFSAFGLIAGLFYRSLVRGGPVGNLLYPPIFVGLLEVLRTTYVNAPRGVLIFAGALFLLSQMRRLDAQPSHQGLHALQDRGKTLAGAFAP
jgi:hypothetical protein